MLLAGGAATDGIGHHGRDIAGHAAAAERLQRGCAGADCPDSHGKDAGGGDADWLGRRGEDAGGADADWPGRRCGASAERQRRGGMPSGRRRLLGAPGRRGGMPCATGEV